MEIADRIRKLGFHRWYERQLIESHVYLVTCVLCMILVTATLGEFSFRAPGLRPVLMLAAAFCGGLLGIFSWGRYRDIMLRAERIADGAICGRCSAYAAFKVIASGPRAERPYPDGESRLPDEQNNWFKVRCKKCGHEWTIG